jgi:hypothetical protein
MWIRGSGFGSATLPPTYESAELTRGAFLYSEPATWRPECRCALDPQTPAPTRAAPRSVPIPFSELEKNYPIIV